MKVFWLTLVGASILTLLGCQIRTTPSIVRVALNADSAEWQLAVNRVNQGSTLSGSTLTQELSSLRLRQGDVMLLRLSHAQDSAPVKETREWLWGFCQSNNLAIYVMPETFPKVDMFSVRAYHWTAPNDNPFDLAKAMFFCEGQFIGRSTNGFEKMLHQIASDRPSQVFILGSLFDMGRSFPPNPSPYEYHQDRLYSVLRAAGTDFIRLDMVP